MPHSPVRDKPGRRDKSECGTIRGRSLSLGGTSWDSQVLVSRKTVLDQGCMDSDRNRQFIKEGKDTPRM